MPYLRYWSLRHPPFAATPGFFFVTAAQRAVLAGVESWVTKKKPFGLIVSPTGCGTTTLLKYLATSSGFGDCATEVLFTSGRVFNRIRPIDAIAKLLGLPPSDGLEAIVANALKASARQDIHTVWMIDDCTPSDAITLQGMAMNHQSLTIMVAGNAALAGMMKIGSSIVLNPLSRQETSEYIKQSIGMAGQTTNMFDASAMTAIHQHSGGRIKRIGDLAGRSLILGHRLRLRRIRANHVAQLMRQQRAA